MEETKMQIIEQPFTVRKLMENIESNNIVFNHPMQRKAGQWDEEQKSLLIHSVVGGYAIPQTYGLQLFDNDVESFSVLDGKQRYTTLYDFLHDGFKLADDTPSVLIKRRKIVTNGQGERRAEERIEEYEIAGKYFSELDECLKNKIKDREFSVLLLTNCTDEEIEDQFFRLNNGTALTKDQKTKVILGDDLARYIERLEEKPFFTRKCYFTKAQIKHGEVQTCILQTLMLILDYPFKNFTNDTVMDFAKWVREKCNKSDLDYCEDIFSKLDKAIPETEKPNKLMKKINIPILAYHIQTIDELGISTEKYGEWIQKFFDSYTPECEYASYCGQSSTSKNKVKARLDYVEKELRKLVE